MKPPVAVTPTIGALEPIATFIGILNGEGLGDAESTRIRNRLVVAGWRKPTPSHT